jgi:hypothetical protein
VLRGFVFDLQGFRAERREVFANEIDDGQARAFP